jgi:hypothetical protein
MSDKIKVISRAWVVTVDPYALEASPLARDYAERLLDISVQTSVQSLTETREELKRIELEMRTMASRYEEQSKGFRRGVMYKGKFEAMTELIALLNREIQVYDQRIEANKKNNGRILS